MKTKMKILGPIRLWRNLQFLRKRALLRFANFRLIVNGYSRGNLSLARLRPLSSLDGDLIWSRTAHRSLDIPVTIPHGSPAVMVSNRIGKRVAIRAREVVFEPYSEILLQRGKVFRQPLDRQLLWEPGREDLHSCSKLIAWNSGKVCIASPSQADYGNLEEIPRGILLGGQSSNNWYHWVVNVLPKAFIADHLIRFPVRYPYLVSESIRGTRMAELLELMSSKKREIWYLEDKPHLVGEALVIDSPTREIYRAKNLVRRINWRWLGSFDAEVMSGFRSHILRKISSRPARSPRGKDTRLFFLRSQNTRPYNQADVEALVQEFGFRSVNMEALPVFEQIRLLSSCEFAVGPTGAQWASWLFSSNATGLILVPKFLTRSTLFSKLGALGSSRLFEFEMETDQMSWPQYFSTREASYVDIKKLREIVERMLEEQHIRKPKRPDRDGSPAARDGTGL